MNVRCFISVVCRPSTCCLVDGNHARGRRFRSRKCRLIHTQGLKDFGGESSFKGFARNTFYHISENLESVVRIDWAGPWHYNWRLFRETSKEFYYPLVKRLK